MKNNFINLDCTFRDGGYHNNWNFKKPLIDKYLKCMSKLKINFIELGFRFLNRNKSRGETAYTEERFINQLRIPENLNIGVMINAGDFLSHVDSIEVLCNKTFPNIKKSKIKFVRIACHFHEIFKISKIISWLKKRNILVAVNLMQISEINKKQIEKVCKFISKAKIDIFYVADSLGCMRPQDINSIFKEIKKFWKGECGIHAHDNLHYALKNSIIANKNHGVNWLDSTVLGMGRGPGNLKTEEIINHSKRKKNKNLIKKLIKENFSPLKKKYKWGSNLYYRLAAKFKIHPTYIQEMLTDKRYKKKNYLQIIKNLSRNDSTKFNPFKLISPQNVYTKDPIGKGNPFTDIKKKDVLIIGAGSSAKILRKKIENFIKQNNVYVISLNTNQNISENLINLRVASHPFRISSDVSLHSKNKTKLAIPASMLPKNIFDKIKSKKKLIDYGLSINMENKIIIKKNFCILPNALAISYSLAIAIAGKSSKIFLAGFDGYKVDDSKNDETQSSLNLFTKRFDKLKISFLTPTKYKLK